jgi:dynein heavy chain
MDSAGETKEEPKEEQKCTTVHSPEAIQNIKDILDGVDKASIQEIKSFSNPPAGIKEVAGAVWILFEVEIDKKNPDYWKAFRTLANNPKKLLESMKSFDIENVSEETKTKITKYIEDNPASTDFDALASKSKAASCLAGWVKGVTDYIKGTNSAE